MATSVWNVNVTTVCGKRYVIPALVFASFLLYFSYTAYGRNSVDERTTYPSPLNLCATSKDCQSNCSVCLHQSCHDVTEGVPCSAPEYVQRIQSYLHRKSGNDVVVSGVICLERITKIKCLVKENSKIHTLINAMRQDIHDSSFRVCMGALWILQENSLTVNNPKEVRSNRREPKVLNNSDKVSDVDVKDRDTLFERTRNRNRFDTKTDAVSSADRGVLKTQSQNSNFRNIQGAYVKDSSSSRENIQHVSEEGDLIIDKKISKTNFLKNLRPPSVEKGGEIVTKSGGSLRTSVGKDNKFSPNKVVKDNVASKANSNRKQYSSVSNTLESRIQAAPDPRSSSLNKNTSVVIDKEVQSVFEDIASRGSWGGGSETRSGPGSLLASTVTLRECLGMWIKKYDITSIVDIPCGDANWQRYIPGIENIAYRGYDISSIAVSRAKTKNPVKNMLFGMMDITSKIPPKADLVILRDVIQHLPLSLGLRAINNVRRSGAKWIGISSYPDSTSNKNIKIGDYYHNNIQIAPFNMKNMIESCDNYSGKEKNDHPGSMFLLFRNKLSPI